MVSLVSFTARETRPPAVAWDLVAAVVHTVQLLLQPSAGVPAVKLFDDKYTHLSAESVVTILSPAVVRCSVILSAVVKHCQSPNIRPATPAVVKLRISTAILSYPPAVVKLSIS
jgi:hypothetical protein